MKAFTILACLFTFNSIFCQDGKDVFNKELLEKQRETAKKVMLYLEYGSVSLALDNFDNAADMKFLLEKASESLKVVRQTAKGQTVIVFSENHNIVRCRYYTSETNYTPVYLMDLHFTQGDPNSKVIKVEIKEKTILEKEAKEREASTEIPEPPPAPR